jgi:uncharacterized protein
METSIWIFIAVGFLAQMIDGALGMAYGVSSNAFLLSIGIPPAAASASVHAAEVVTTAVSGVSHWRFGNIDKKLLLRLMLPGVIGAAIGAYILSSLPGRHAPTVYQCLFAGNGSHNPAQGVHHPTETNP